MTVLHTWAATWGIPAEAMVDLQQRMMTVMDDATPKVNPKTGEPGSEARQQSLVRLEAPKYGVWLTRNNVGGFLTDTGRPVYYGLCHETPQQNETIKSADLIGIRPVLIGPHHVGTTIGQFVSREMKAQDWKWCGDKHETAQMNWNLFVLSKGGDAAFCTGPGSFNYRGSMQ